MFRRMILASLVLLSLSSWGPALGDPSPPEPIAVIPGYYMAPEGAGILKIEKDGNFSINSSGSNSHSCELSGTIDKNSQALIDTDIEDPIDGKSYCKIVFSKTSKGYLVTVDRTTFYSCRSFCGMHASFDGDYEFADPICKNPFIPDFTKDTATAQNIKKWRQDLKKYEDKCLPYADLFYKKSLPLNHAYLKFLQRDKAGCRAEMAPFKTWIGKTEAQIHTQEDDFLDGFSAEQNTKILNNVNMLWRKCH